jgi:trigger factor
MVSTEVKDIDQCRRELKITIPADRLAKIRQSNVRVVQKEAAIQGFRKGRAPLHMVNSMYAGTIEKYTLDEALQTGYEEGLQGTDLEPVGQPVIKKFDYDDSQNLIIEVEVEIFPEIEVKKYKGLKIDKTVYVVEDDDVDDQLNLILKEKATITGVDDPAEKGHYITIDLQELDETGMPLVGKKYEDIRIQLGEGQFDADLEQQLTGLHCGDEKFIEKKFQQKFQIKKSNKKTERYRVTVKSVEKEDLPEFNDDFVTQLNVEDLKTVDDLRNRVRSQMEHQWAQESEQKFYHDFVHELLQHNPFEVPEAMIQNYLDHIVSEIEKKDQKVDLENVRKKYRVDAMFNIKWYHLKKRISELENLNADDSDFDTYLEKIEDDKTKKLYRQNPEIKQRVLSDLFEKKVFDFLVENSKVKSREQSIKKRKEIADV